MYKFKSYTYTRLISIFAMLYIFSQPVWGYESSRDDADIPVIRAALGLDLDRASIKLSVGGRVFDPIRNKDIAKYSKSTDFEIRVQQNRFSVDKLNELYTELEFHPSSGNYVGHGNKTYRGYIKVVALKTGIWVINYVNMEEYLYGVIPFEVPMSWNIEAIKAQSVAARTYAVKCLGQYPHGLFDVYDSVRDQVYGGVSAKHPNGIRAVEGTRGVVLTYQGWPVTAYYHADAGGHTEDGGYVFPGDLPYLKGVPSKDDLKGHRWHFIMKRDELKNLVVKERGGIGELKEIRISKISPTGRPREIEVIGTLRTKAFSTNDFRRMIGPGRVRSTLFTIVGSDNVRTLENADSNMRVVSYTRSPDRVGIISSNGIRNKETRSLKVIGASGFSDVQTESMKIVTTSRGNVFKPETNIKPGKDEYLFVGSGFGHGAGMSQWGAKAYADDGWDYRRILLHYYQGAEVSVWY